jgi:hypothetical protein
MDIRGLLCFDTRSANVATVTPSLALFNQSDQSNSIATPMFGFDRTWLFGALAFHAAPLSGCRLLTHIAQHDHP